MSTITYPNTLTPNTLEDANQVMGNFNAITAVANGNLEAVTNIKIAAPIAQTSAALSAGASANLARADHSHTIQCTEQLAADPSSGNFVGRRYFNTGTLKERMCIATGGSGTWVTMGNYAASDLPLHAGNHVPSGAGNDLFNPPACQVTATGAISIPTGGTTGTAILWTVESFDTANMHDNATNTSRILMPYAGVYDMEASLEWAPNTTGYRRAWIKTSGGVVVCADNATSPSAPENAFTNPVGSFKSAGGDYVELWAFQNSGGSLNILGTTNTGSDNFAFAPPCFFTVKWRGTGA